MRLIRTALCVAFALCPSVLFAQSFTGTITGTLKDVSGASIPGANITVTNQQTSKQDTVVTDVEGRYTSLPLPPGEYRVDAGLQGFRRAARTVTVQINSTVVIDFTLEVGDLTDEVEVRADATLLETSSGTVGKLVDNRRILELPLNTRNVYSLIFLTPGVAGTIGNNYNSMSYSVNGARPTMMDTVIDGVTASFPTVNGFTGISVFPSVDAIQEFKVLGANYPAEYGRSLGSVLNVVYKSGTNQFHGSAYEFFRDSALDSNNYFAKRAGTPLGDYQRSQFGGVAGGPIQRGRTFFMTSFEGLREQRQSQTTTTVPTLAQRQGDFSQTLAQNGQLIRVFDPFSTRANPAGGFIRDQFEGNRIPANLLDPVARNVLNYFPLPNQAGNAVTGAQNYFSTGNAELNVDNIDGRVDHQLSDNQKMFVRYSYRKTFSAPAIFFPADIAVAEGRVNEQNRAHNFVTDYNRTMSNTTVLNARLGFARTLFIFDNQGLGFKPSSLGLPTSIDDNVDREMFPRFGVSGMVSLGGNDHRYNAFMSYTAAASLTKVRGAHGLKVGFEGRMLRVNVWEARSAGTFNFRANETQGPNPTTASSTAGYGMASFLLGFGQPNDVLIQNWKNVAANSFYWAGYAQDDWRINNRMTVNLGLRYDIDVPRTERYDRMNYFDPDARSPLAGQVAGFPDLKGGVVFVGVDGNSRYQYQLGHQQHRAAPRPLVSGRFEDGRQGRLQPHVRTVEPGRAGHGRAVRVPYREPVGDVDRRHHAPQPAEEPLSERLRALSGIVAGAAHAGGRQPAGAAAGHALTLEQAIQRERAAGTAVGDVPRGRLRRHARLRPVDGRRGRHEPESARSSVHVARVAAQSAGSEPLLRDREQRRPDAADGRPRTAAAALSAVHRRHPALRLGREVRVRRHADDRPQAPDARPDVRGLVHLRAGAGNRHEPPGQL